MALDHVACAALKEVFTNVEEKPSPCMHSDIAGKCATPGWSFGVTQSPGWSFGVMQSGDYTEQAKERRTYGQAHALGMMAGIGWTR
jgi:hypothetical protein